MIEGHSLRQQGKTNVNCHIWAILSLLSFTSCFIHFSTPVDDSRLATCRMPCVCGYNHTSDSQSDPNPPIPNLQPIKSCGYNHTPNVKSETNPPIPIFSQLNGTN